MTTQKPPYVECFERARIFHFGLPIVELRQCSLCGTCFEARPEDLRPCPKCERERLALAEYHRLVRLRWQGIATILAVMGFCFGFYVLGGLWQ